MAITPAELAAMIVLEAQQMHITVPHDDLVQMVSIPSRESTYDPFAHNDTAGTQDNSFGLYQINMLGNMGPNRARALGITDYTQLYDPWINVRAMLQLYAAAGNKLTAWGGYKGMPNDYNVTPMAKQAAATAVNQVMAAAAYGQIVAPDLSRFQATYASKTGGMQLSSSPGAPVQSYPQTGPGTLPDTGAGGLGGGGGGDVSLERIAGGYQEAGPYAGMDPATVAKQLYGYLAAYLDDPGLVDPDTGKNIILEAAELGWSPDRLAGKLSETTWWQTTQDTARKFDAERNTDPASANAKIAAAVDTIQSEAVQLGLDIDPGRLQEIALNSVRLGWNDSQIRKALGAEAQRNPAEIARSQLASLQGMASDYAQKYLDPDLQKWAAGIIGGTATTQQFQSELIDKASAMFPTIAESLAKGQTVKQYMDPYTNEFADLLEINPSAIDITDPKWTSILMGADDKGNRRPMSLGEAADYIRQTPTYGWNMTKNANDRSAQFATSLAKIFGVAA